MADVRILRDPRALDALGPAWDALLARSASDTVFLTADWLQTWWEVYGAACEPCIALVREGERLVAAAPCKIERRRRYGIPFRQLDFIGTGRAVCPDFLDLVVERGREADLVPVLVDALRGAGGWDKLALGDVCEDAATFGPLTAALGAAGLQPRSEADRVCPYLPLPPTWGELEQRLSHNFRRNHRKKRRRLGATLAPWRAGDDVPAALDRLAALHQDRMESAGRGGNFRKPDYRAFHTRFAARAAERGWLYLAFLDAGDRSIAGRYGFLYRGTYYAYQSGFDPAAADVSPGEVLLGMVIEDLIGRGAREFNFLRGTQPHKFHWTDRRRQTMRAEGYARSARGRVLALLDRIAARRRQLRRRFPAVFGMPTTPASAAPPAGASAEAEAAA